MTTIEALAICKSISTENTYFVRKDAIYYSHTPEREMVFEYSISVLNNSITCKSFHGATLDICVEQVKGFLGVTVDDNGE